MTCTVISIYRRPDKNVSWHTKVFGNVNPAFKEEAEKVNLPQRRKITEVDDLTLEIEVVWDSRVDYENFMNIEVVKNHFNMLNYYNQNAKITQDPKQFIEN